MYMGAHDWLSQTPSMEASLIGWFSVTVTADCEPNIITWQMLRITKKGRAALKAALAKSWYLFFSRYHELTLKISAEPIIQEATQTCNNRARKEGVKTTSTKLVITARG